MSDSVRPHRRQPTRLPRPWDSPGKSAGVGCQCLLQILLLTIYKTFQARTSSPTCGHVSHVNICDPESMACCCHFTQHTLFSEPAGLLGRSACANVRRYGIICLLGRLASSYQFVCSLHTLEQSHRCPTDITYHAGRVFLLLVF